MRPWPLVALVCACAAPRAVADKASHPGRPPDVIVITVDTLRADRLGAWGYANARTPTIDGLAAGGVRFASAMTPQPRTTPGLASLWTGLWPHHHGAREVHFPRRDGTMISEVLRARGYATRAISANAAASAVTRLDTGFDRFEQRSGEEASAVTDLAIELADAPEDVPLLLWAHYYDPHAPYAPPAAASPPPYEACSELQRERRWNEALSNRNGVSAAVLPECARAYDAEVAWADRHIARLLEHLGAAGRLKRAFVVFTSDHGEGMGERNLWYEHGPNVHGSNLHIPLSIGGPGIAGGRVVEDGASLVDVAPTLYELLGIPAADRPAADGASLAAVLRGEASAPRLVHAESADALTPLYGETLISGRAGLGYCLNGPRFAFCWVDRNSAPTLHDRAADPDHLVDLAAQHPEEYAVLRTARSRWAPTGGAERAVSDGRYKLLQRPRIEGGYAETLYDLSVDPAEADDVAAAHPEIVERLRAALEPWERDMRGRAPVSLSPEQEAALRALGYIE